MACTAVRWVARHECRLGGYLIPWSQDNSTSRTGLSSFYSSSPDQETRVPGVLVRFELPPNQSSMQAIACCRAACTIPRYPQGAHPFYARGSAVRCLPCMYALNPLLSPHCYRPFKGQGACKCLCRMRHRRSDFLTAACDHAVRLCAQVSALGPIAPGTHSSATLLTGDVTPANAAALPIDQVPFADVRGSLPPLALPSPPMLFLGKGDDCG